MVSMSRARPCGSLNRKNRSGHHTPTIATATLVVSHTPISALPVRLRACNAVIAIIGARHGRTGTRNRAGALDPPHHI